jgi:large-conductance mechanosensitive channel
VTRQWIVDVAIGIAIGIAIAALVLMSSFNSTFIYRGF